MYLKGWILQRSIFLFFLFLIARDVGNQLTPFHVHLTIRWITRFLSAHACSDRKCPSWSKKRGLVACRKGYCSLDAKAWASRLRLATGKHYLSRPIYKTVTVWSSRYLVFWVALVSFKNKVQACWRNPKGWVSALLPPPLLSARPQTNCETAGVQVRPRVGHYSPTMTLLSSTFWVS